VDVLKSEMDRALIDFGAGVGAAVADDAFLVVGASP
jgi:hypothetical protein